MTSDKADTPTSDEILSHITKSVTTKNIMMNLITDIRQSENDILSKYQKTQADLNRTLHLNENNSSDNQMLQDEILSAKEKLSLYREYYQKIYDMLPIHESRIRDMEKENANFGPILDKVFESKMLIEKENLALKEALKDLDNCKDSFERDTSRLLDELSNSAGEINSLREELRNERSKLANLQMDYNHLSEDLGRVQQENSTLKESQQSVVDDRDRLIQELNNKISEFAVLENKLQDLTNKRSGSEISFNIMISKKDDEIKKLNEQLIKAKNEVNDLNTSLGNYQKELEQQEKELEKVVEDNVQLQRQLTEAEKKHSEANSKYEIYYDRSEAQQTMLKERLAKIENLLTDAKHQNTSLIKANHNLSYDISEIVRDKRTLEHEVRKSKLDLDHERSSKKQLLNIHSDEALDPFDRLKFSKPPIVQSEESFSLGSFSRRFSIDDSSSSNEMPNQIANLLQNMDDDDEVSLIFKRPSAPLPPQNANILKGDDGSVSRESSRKRKFEEHVVPLNEETAKDINDPGASGSGSQKKSTERRSTRFQAQKEKFPVRNWSSYSKKKRDDIPEISSSIPETPYGSPSEP